MKKLLFLLTITFFVFPLYLNAASEPARKPRCCQVTKTDGKTMCREREANCIKYGNDPEGEYLIFGAGSTCSAKAQLKTVFQEGRCVENLSNTNSLSDLEIVGTKAGFSNEQKNTNAVTNYIGKIIKFALSITGLIFLTYTLYSGFQWMTAGGNANQVSEARTRLIQSAIGMMITAVAYSAAVLIIKIIGGQS